MIGIYISFTTPFKIISEITIIKHFLKLQLAPSGYIQALIQLVTRNLTKRNRTSVPNISLQLTNPVRLQSSNT